MAQKRMFDKAIIDTDKFMDLSMSSKALYFLLGMEADDEGFVSPRKVLRIHGGNEDDIRVLMVKNFLIPFESGVVVITDWNKNNYLNKNRIRKTEYQKERKMLNIVNDQYTLDKDSKKLVKPMLNQYSIEEYSIEENSIDNTKKIKNVDKLWSDMIKPYLETTPKGTIIDFENYWRQKNQNGKKELWQMQKVFDVSRRLKTWIRNGEKFEFRKESMENLKKINEKPISNQVRSSNGVQSIGELINTNN